MISNYALASGVISQLVARTKSQLTVTPGKKEDYSAIPLAVAKLILSLTSDKDKMTKLNTANNDLASELVELRTLLTVFGIDSEIGVGLEKGNAATIRKVYGAKIAVATDKAKTLYQETWGFQWPSEAVLCLYVGQMALPLVRGHEDPDDLDSDVMLYTPANTELNIPQLQVQIKEQLVGTRIKVAGFTATMVKGTSSLKGKYFFNGRIANFVKNENGQISDKHGVGAVMAAALSTDNDIIAEHIEPARFGGGGISKLFTDDSVAQGIYPVVSVARENRSDDKGSKWINTNVTVITPQGDISFRLPPADADAFLPTLLDLYPSVDENGTSSQPQGLIFDDGLRGIAYFGWEEYTRNGKTLRKPKLALVSIENDTPYIAPAGTTFDVFTQKFVFVPDASSQTRERGLDDDGEKDMGEEGAMSQWLDRWDQKTMDTAPQKSKTAVAVLDEDDDDDDAFSDM